MSQNSEASKTEKPTPKKLKDARKDGSVGHSRDLSTCMAICAVVIAVSCFYDMMLARITDNYFAVAMVVSDGDFGIDKIINVLGQLVYTGVLIFLPLVILTGLVAMLTTVIQYGGFLLTNRLAKFDFNKFNIVENAKQIFAQKNIIKFVFNCIKVLIMLFVGVLIVSDELGQILLLPNVAFSSMIFVVVRLTIRVFFVLLGIYFFFALIDFVMEKRATYKKLMMSIDEIRKEYKETDGNPEIKYRRRAMHRELLEDDNDDVFDNFKDSMIVLANPTHIAVVLVYVPQKWQLPVVVLKAKGELAQDVFRVSKKHNIPIIRDKWLARKMYDLAEVNQIIPVSMHKLIAELIAKYLYLRPVIADSINKMASIPLANK